MKKGQKTMEAELDFVAIIDGLPDAQRKQCKISENLTHYLASNGIEQMLSLCDDRDMFYNTMEYFKTLAKAGKKFCLHIICHGDQNGIGINKSSDEMIIWEGFTKILAEINTFMEDKLIINMTSCYGLHGIKIVDENSAENPFFGLIGPSKKINVKKAIEINEFYYSKQLKGKQIQKIIEEINEEYGKPIIYCISADGYKKIKNGLKKANS